MKLLTDRPEDRRRRPDEQAPWADTLPACFRSEGFAEDLPEVDLGPASPASAPSGPWLSDAALPLLGVALAGVLGLFAR